MRAFPTWQINGRVIEGELTLDQLEDELDDPPAAHLGSEGAGAPAPAGR